ncbi:hypothetical protein [Fundicoccus culcitae]|uniref:CAP-associated domain-containing protein n=1 Tax=Fundicoccus culcitae TaxID=2969821 RepID=A0ABY5P2N2_9LACT|nr:hypothetical protein [Fundicoccus culcitae]UUX32979.1 hypothetical protein NRE15_08625 [Fundicoccus culcitae]
MKKKTIVYLSLLTSFLLQFNQNAIYAQDDSESVVESQAVSVEENAEEAIDLLALNEVQLEEGNPLSVIEALQSQPRYVSNGFNYLEAVNADEFAVRSLRYVRDGDLYYLMHSAPSTINSSVLIETNQGEFQRSLIPSDDLMAAMAEGLNNYPDLYAGTTVEAFYQYAQLNSDEISGLMIDNEYATAEHQLMYDEIRAVDDYFLTRLFDYFQTEGVDFSTVETEVGEIYYYDVTQENRDAFQALLLDGQDEANNDGLEGVFEFFSQPFTGSIAISMDTASLSLSMINDDETHAVEYFIGLNQLAIAQPTDDQVITADAFNEMIGLELFSALENAEESAQ